ncbi:hypothetical protein [Janthinobacterium sp.]|jgi:hypothetical protein|uniref:hypothetical protein n=1 Tax=Janthinobacterium sp. TaxID=1871054 RepID=UPI00260B67D8|nr:hypothetical protein [Janthinobacterium sp.]
MATTSFNIDSKLDSTLENLKVHYGAASKAEVLRKAIALLNVVSRNENEDGSVTIRHNEQDVKVILR